MKKIMFVCTGNICRSAMAEYLMNKILQDKGLQNDMDICSSGVFAYNNQNPTQKAIEVMKEKNIDITGHSAVNTANSNIMNMDLILCMTNAHKLQINHRYPELMDKTYTLKEYVVYDNNQNKDVNIEDPYGFGVSVYQECIGQIESCLYKLIDIIR